MRSYGVDTCHNKAFYNLDLGNIINLNTTIRTIIMQDLPHALNATTPTPTMMARN
ncbi:hypothetical protein HpNP141_02390 [Helicobacter pylori]|nr:hypothetical protein KVL21_02185 [Helicobacter pylori]